VGGADVGECAAVPADCGGHRRDEASCGAAGAEQVDGNASLDNEAANPARFERHPGQPMTRDHVGNIATIG
jgi:hypothetical protein